MPFPLQKDDATFHTVEGRQRRERGFPFDKHAKHFYSIQLLSTLLVQDIIPEEHNDQFFQWYGKKIDLGNETGQYFQL